MRRLLVLQRVAPHKITFYLVIAAYLLLAAVARLPLAVVAHLLLLAAVARLPLAVVAHLLLLAAVARLPLAVVAHLLLLAMVAHLLFLAVVGPLKEDPRFLADLLKADNRCKINSIIKVRCLHKWDSNLRCKCRLLRCKCNANSR